MGQLGYWEISCTNYFISFLEQFILTEHLLVEEGFATWSFYCLIVINVYVKERQTRARNRNSGDPKSSPVTPAASQISSTSSADEASSANKRATRRSARAAVAATAAEEPVSEQTTTNGSSAKRRLTRKDVFKPTEENSKQVIIKALFCSIILSWLTLSSSL